MADIKKLVEDLAAQAGIAAKGATPCCNCCTYEDAVAHAEQIIEDLCKTQCADSTFVILTTALARYQTVMMRTLGTIPTLEHMVEAVNTTADMGTPVGELQNKISAWHATVTPHPEGS